MPTHFYYRLQKPLALVILALFLLIFANSAPIFAGATLIASIFALRDLFLLVTYPNTIRFSTTLAVSILLGYGLGSLIYLGNHLSIHAADYQYWAHQGLLFTQRGLSTALATAFLACAGLYTLALIERPVLAGLPTDSIANIKSEKLVWLAAAVALLALYNGDIGYEGAVKSESGNVSVLGAITTLLVPALIPCALLLMLNQTSLLKKTLLMVTLVCLCGILLLLGRRYILYVVVLSAIALFMRGQKLTNKQIALASFFALFSVAFVYWGFNFFFALRMAVRAASKDASLEELVSSALANLNGPGNALLQEKLARNVATRPFILSYFAGLMGTYSDQMPALGKELVYSLQMAIPSILLSWKATLAEIPEAMVHPLYGIPVFDGPNSFLVAGFDDFGIPGAIVYPLGIAWLYRKIYKILCFFVRDPTIMLFVFFALLFKLFYIEQSFAASFVMFRNLTIVIVAGLCIKNLCVFLFVQNRSERSGFFRHDPYSG